MPRSEPLPNPFKVALEQEPGVFGRNEFRKTGKGMYKFKRIIHLVPYDEPLIGKGTDSNAVVSSRVLDVAFRLATGKDMRFFLLVEHFLYLLQDILRGITGPETDNSKVFLPSAENGKRTGGTKHPQSHAPRSGCNPK